MMSNHMTGLGRRQALTLATNVFGVAGVFGAAIPFVRSMAPSERARARGGPIRVDVSRIEPGKQWSVEWRGKPAWLLHRTPEMLHDLNRPALRERLRDPESTDSPQQPDYAENVHRSIRPEYFVAIGLCTHLGCVPLFQPTFDTGQERSGWRGGYYCPCHGSKFDFAGRVYKDVPAPTNLVIPPHRYVADTVVEIGAHSIS